MKTAHEIIGFINECMENQKYETIWENLDGTRFGCDVGFVCEWWEQFKETLIKFAEEK